MVRTSGPDHLAEDWFEVGTVPDELVCFGPVAKGFVGKVPGHARSKEDGKLSRRWRLGMEQRSGPFGRFLSLLRSGSVQDIASSDPTVDIPVGFDATVLHRHGEDGSSDPADLLLASGPGRVQVKAALDSPADLDPSLVDVRRFGRPRERFECKVSQVLLIQLLHRSAQRGGLFEACGRGDSRRVVMGRAMGEDPLEGSLREPSATAGRVPRRTPRSTRSGTRPGR